MNTEHFKQKLEEERATIEAELAEIAQKNPSVPGKFEATAGDFDALAAEPEEEAQKFQEEENNEGVVRSLEHRLKDVKLALQKIAESSYGICEISGERIEEARLEANPTARTCIAHKDEEERLSV